VQADLALVQRGPTAAEQERTQRMLSSWSGTTLDLGRFTIDAAVGYPYFVFARLTTGLVRRGQFGLDVGVEVRTSFLDTQIGLRPRVQLVRIDPFSLGVDVTILGGGGPTNRNSFTFEVGPTATLAAGQFVHFSVKPYLGVWSDRLCPSVDDIKSDDASTGMMVGGAPKPGSGTLYTKDEKEICKAYDRGRPNSAYQLPGTGTMFGLFGQPDPRERFTTVRFLLQLAIEVAVSKSLSIFGMIEGAPFQDQRQSFTSKFMPVYQNRDEPPLYGRA